MRFNALDLIQYFAVALPVLAMFVVATAVAIRWLKQLLQKPVLRRNRRLLKIAVATTVMQMGFLPFASIYRPNLIEVAKSQIAQQEDADEDDSGDPESSQKCLDRQLRRIRRGEKVETIFLECE